MRYTEITKILVFATVFLGLSACAHSKNNDFEVAQMQGFKLETVTTGLGMPWALEFINDNEILLNIKSGEIKKLNLKTKKISTIQGGPQSVVHGQGGLLDLALHPNFKNNQRLYFTYTKKVKDGYTTALATGVLQGNQVTGLKDLFVANNPSDEGRHFGSRITFDEEGYLYFTVGDRGERDLAQDLNADQGKVHRLKLNGETPKDNFKGTIWSWGHRNPQGLVYDKKSKKLFAQEHGPRGGDEINIIEKGKNYGWPVITYGREYWGPKIGETHKEGMEQPLYYHTPSIAPCGMDVYNHSKVPAWQGSLFSGALKLQHLNQVYFKSPSKIREVRWLQEQQERVRDVKVGPDGWVYLSTDSGKVLRLSKKSS